MSEEIITHTAEETIRWGREFSKRLKAPVLVLLTGELGTGKTTLTKGIVSGLGVANEDDVTSPTFTLVHVYGRPAEVYHADLYRIESLHDFETGPRSECILSTWEATSVVSLSCKPPEIWGPRACPYSLVTDPSGFLARLPCGC